MIIELLNGARRYIEPGESVEHLRFVKVDITYSDIGHPLFHTWLRDCVLPHMVPSTFSHEKKETEYERFKRQMGPLPGSKE